MNTVFNLIIVVQVISALAIIGLVLVQHGKGADMGAAFGSGASGSLFGASGSSNFLSKSTAVAAAVFFASTLALAWSSNSRSTGGEDAGVMGRVTVPSSQAPATGIPSDVPGAGPNAGPTTVVPANDIPQTPGVAVPAVPGEAAPAPAAPAAPAAATPAPVAPAPTK